MGKPILLLLAGIFFIIVLHAQAPATPDKLYGRFFHDVQMARVFTDSKTFVDCTPKKSPAEIVAAYQKIISNPAIRFSIKLFTEENFEQPVTPQLNYITKEKDIQQHIKNLWSVLKRKADTVANTSGNSLLPLPYPYIVPGGRFREIYYWDSYFTMLGLKESGENDMMENMVKNFAFLIDSFGHIPNGNRSYYLSRSQPPFFSLMVELLASVKGDAVYATYLPQLEKEYRYWMEGSDKLKPMQAEKSVVKLKDGSVLNRYWDDLDIPRQEAYYEDQTLAEKYPARAKKLNRDLRAAAASGWDFSSRWFADGKNISSIQTTNIIPVDLNCLLYKLELTIAKAKLVTANDSTVALYRKKASARLAAIDKYCWNKSVTFYTDYNFTTQRQSIVVTPAGMYPFCFFTEKTDYMSLLARNVGEVVKSKLLKAGGIVTTENNTGQQWDAPNGWAPLQWMTIWGFDKCGQKELARDIAERWLKLNLEVFNRTGKLMEKYNVVDNKLEAGGGEYPSQDGFGWTNGVFLKLVSIYGMPQQ
ncbi:MAG: alpha,alpha-trehalase TreA [Chitinophagaceae bacterium]